jgi:hypothetical protein
VLKSTLKEAKMAHRNRKAVEEMAQETLLLDDPGFLKEITERVLQNKDTSQRIRTK